MKEIMRFVHFVAGKKAIEAVLERNIPQLPDDQLCCIRYQKGVHCPGIVGYFPRKKNPETLAASDFVEILQISIGRHKLWRRLKSLPFRHENNIVQFDCNRLWDRSCISSGSVSDENISTRTYSGFIVSERWEHCEPEEESIICTTCNSNIHTRRIKGTLKVRDIEEKYEAKFKLVLTSKTLYKKRSCKQP